MSFLLKLVYRDFTRRRAMMAFALLAIMATCGLIVWFVATINPRAFSEDDGTQTFYGTYSLAIASPRELPVELADAVEANPSAKKNRLRHAATGSNHAERIYRRPQTKRHG